MRWGDKEIGMLGGASVCSVANLRKIFLDLWNFYVDGEMGNSVFILGNFQMSATSNLSNNWGIFIMIYIQNLFLSLVNLQRLKFNYVMHNFDGFLYGNVTNLRLNPTFSHNLLFISYYKCRENSIHLAVAQIKKIDTSKSSRNGEILSRMGNFSTHIWVNLKHFIMHHCVR